MPSGKLDDLMAMGVGDRVRKYDQAAVRLARSRGNGTFEIGAVACTGHGRAVATPASSPTRLKR
jgi:hypothetical protein